MVKCPRFDLEHTAGTDHRPEGIATGKGKLLYLAYTVGDSHQREGIAAGKSMLSNDMHTAIFWDRSTCTPCNQCFRPFVD